MTGSVVADAQCGHVGDDEVFSDSRKTLRHARFHKSKDSRIYTNTWPRTCKQRTKSSKGYDSASCDVRVVIPLKANKANTARGEVLDAKLSGSTRDSFGGISDTICV